MVLSRKGEVPIPHARSRPVSTVPIPRSGGYLEAVQRILEFARLQASMDVAWMSSFVDGAQVFQSVSSSGDGRAPEPGSSLPYASSYCARVLDGQLRPLVRDARHDLRTRDLPMTDVLDIACYVGAPIIGGNGEVLGMLACISHTRRPDMSERDLATVALLAQMLGDLSDRSTKVFARRDGVRHRIASVVAGEGRRVVLQPIVDTATGVSIGVEALSRFDHPPQPDGWFAEATLAGFGLDLELACARSALDTLARADLPELLNINFSPAALLSPLLTPLLAAVDRTRIVIEITEHAPVEDYESLNKALAPHRAAGARVAIDDAGAGYASFRHILRLAPDFIKVDIGLIRDIDSDPIRQALITALGTVAGTAGARLVAEGVETQAELDTLFALGVPLAQGYLLCKPTRAPALDGYPRAHPR